MAKTYKQKIYDDLNGLLDKYPGAKVSDMLWALNATTEAIWRQLKPARSGKRSIDRCGNDRLGKKITKRYRLA